MATQITLPVGAGSLPQGFCPQTYQQQLDAFTAVMYVTLNQASGSTPIVVSPTKPSDTSVLWLQTDSLGRPTRFYWFSQGSWLALHPTAPGMISPWIGALPTFNSFDGGDASGLSATSGPMWELVTELEGKFPVGAGTLPSTAVIAEGAVGGNDKQTQIPDHTHATGRFKTPNSGRLTEIVSSAHGPAGLTGESVPGTAVENVVTQSLDDLTGDWMGTSQVLNLPDPNTQTVLPPYRGINFIRRTQRLFYSVT